MTSRYFSGVFLAEGSSDMPIAELVEGMFFERGFEVHLSKPDFDLLSRRVGRDVGSKIRAAKELTSTAVVVHAVSCGDAWRRPSSDDRMLWTYQYQRRPLVTA